MTPALSLDSSRVRTLSLLMLVAAVYAGSLGASFQFDDWNVIVGNPGVHSWTAWWERMPGIRPLLKATYVASWTAGWGPAGFRAVNIALHAMNAWLLLLAVERVLRLCGLPEDRARFAAWFAAAVFALHPAQTETVTYISGRSGGLMTTFLLLALIAHMRRDDSRRPAGWTALAVAAFICAFGAKENAWTFPFTVLAIEAARAQRGPRTPWRASLPYFVALLCGAMAALSIPGYRVLLGTSLETRTALENLLTQIDGQFYLLTHPLFTLQTNADPDLPVRLHWTRDLWPAALTLAGLAAIAVWQWAGRRWLSLGIVWYFVQLSATNSVVPRLDVANDRQLYLALAGPAWMLGAALGSVDSRSLRAAACVSVFAALAAATVMRNGDYRTETSFWESAARVSPGKARVWNNLGYARQSSGDIPGARQAYERALQLDPDHIKARINLSTLEDAAPAAASPMR